MANPAFGSLVTVVMDDDQELKMRIWSPDIEMWKPVNWTQVSEIDFTGMIAPGKLEQLW